MSTKYEGLGCSNAVDGQAMGKGPRGCRIIDLDVKRGASAAGNKPCQSISWCKPCIERFKSLFDLTKAGNLHRALFALFADLIFLRRALCINQCVDDLCSVQTTSCI